MTDLNPMDDLRARAAVRAGEIVVVDAAGGVRVEAGLLPMVYVSASRPGTEMLHVLAEEDLEAIRERKLEFPRPNMHVLMSQALRNGMDAVVEVEGARVIRVVVWPRMGRWIQRLAGKITGAKIPDE